MTSAIHTQGLGKDYKRCSAVKGLDLEVPKGSVFGLLGPNGAGKTTTILMLLGNIRPTRGGGEVLGKPIGDTATRKKIGFLPEKFQFHSFLTASEFLSFYGSLSGMSRVERKERIPELLEWMGLTEKTNDRLRTFSKGMLQRIGLAQALLHNPELIILDEPTSALDPFGRKQVRDIILALKAQGKTVVINSHTLSEIELTCDHIAIIESGELRLQGKVSELLGEVSSVELEVRNLNDEAMSEIRQIVAKVRIEKVPITQFTAWLRKPEDIAELARAIVQNGCDLLALRPKRDTLEELFLRTLSKPENGAVNSDAHGTPSLFTTRS